MAAGGGATVWSSWRLCSQQKQQNPRKEENWHRQEGKAFGGNSVCRAGGGEQDMIRKPWSKFPDLEWSPEPLPWPAPRPATCFPKCLTAASPRSPPGSVAETGWGFPRANHTEIPREVSAPQIRGFLQHTEVARPGGYL